MGSSPKFHEPRDTLRAACVAVNAPSTTSQWVGNLFALDCCSLLRNASRPRWPCARISRPSASMNTGTTWANRVAYSLDIERQRTGGGRSVDPHAPCDTQRDIHGRIAEELATVEFALLPVVRRPQHPARSRRPATVASARTLRSPDLPCG